MAKRTVRLTESELKRMIVESVKNVLKEGFNETVEKEVYFPLADALYDDENWEMWFRRYSNEFPDDIVDATVWYYSTPEDPGDDWTAPNGGSVYVQDVEIHENELTDYLKSVLDEETYLQIIQMCESFVVETTENSEWGRYM